MGSKNNFDLSGPGGLKVMSLSILLCLFLLPSRIDALRCYTCIAIDCPGNSTECEAAREFTLGHLRSLYHLGIYLPRCPKVEDGFEWRLMQAYDSPECPKDTVDAETCAAGRIRISTSRGKDKPGFTTHATILGCARRYLLHSIKMALQEGRCDLFETKGNTTEQQIFMEHRLEIEHCSEIKMLCSNMDFCVRHEQSFVKKLKDRDGQISYARFDVDLVLIIVACIVIVFAAVIGVSLFCRIKKRCSFPFKNPPSNPQDSESEAADTNDLVVAVRSSIEE